MKQGKMKLPEMTTKKVWIGGYGGHYDAIVIFHKKPTPSKEENRHVKGVWFDLLDNKENISGCTDPDSFKLLFGVDVSDCIEAIEVTKLIEMKLTAVWDKYNKLESFDFNLDGWQNA